MKAGGMKWSYFDNEREVRDSYFEWIGMSLPQLVSYGHVGWVKSLVRVEPMVERVRRIERFVRVGRTNRVEDERGCRRNIWCHTKLIIF